MMDERTRLFDTPLGDTVYQYDESVVIKFNGRRNIASTEVLNGGYREDLKFAYNNSCGREIEHKKHPTMKAPTITGHYEVIARELQLDTAVTTGMGTAALMENMATITHHKGALTVMAMVTAGVDVNGGRAGDPASYDELAQKPLPPKTLGGTINIFLHINAKLPPGTLFRALMTATEAKTAALQELMANSCYSEGLATGSGTDSAIIIGNLDSDLYVTNAGKHCVLGELIGTTVKQAVKEALHRQSGMNTTRQARVSYQAKRYGITQEKVQQHYEKTYGKYTGAFETVFLAVDSNPTLVGYVAACLHLIDQYTWGLLDKDTVRKICHQQLHALRADLQLPNTKRHPVMDDRPTEPFYKVVLQSVIKTMADMVLLKNKTMPETLN